MLQIILTILILTLSLPIGIGLAKLTAEEKEIHKQYFPSMLWIIAITASIFWTLNKTNALALTFIFLVILFWHKT